MLVVKIRSASAEDVRDAGSIPGLGRSPGGGHGNPLHYSCLDNPIHRGALWVTVHGSQGWTWLKWLNTHTRRYLLHNTYMWGLHEVLYVNISGTLQCTVQIILTFITISLHWTQCFCHHVSSFWHYFSSRNLYSNIIFHWIPPNKLDKSEPVLIEVQIEFRYPGSLSLNSQETWKYSEELT